jgi:hypothetical protein
LVGWMTITVGWTGVLVSGRGVAEGRSRTRVG